MLALAIIVAIGGYLTIGFSYWALRQAVPASVKTAAKQASENLQSAAQLVKSATERVQRATEAAAVDPARQNEVNAAMAIHAKATENLATATEPVKEVLTGIGSVFQALGSLSPPVAALCVAVLMFLTAGGIEVADRLIH
jgi:sensor c-di-GMP phosphodiesterase-like protein